MPTRSTVQLGRRIIAAEARALAAQALALDGRFERALALVASARPPLLTTAVGKPRFVAQRTAALLASVGRPATYLHPAEALHGDLGQVPRGAVVLALSRSGASEELLRLLPHLAARKAKVVAITARPLSPLARAAAVVVPIVDSPEAGHLGLVPSTSTACLSAVCDALVLALSQRDGFTAQAYALHHPGGLLGRHALTVAEVMRRGELLPLVTASQDVRAALSVMTRTPGRPGAALVVQSARTPRLLGIFTDGDLRRLAEAGALELGRKVVEVMTARPRTTGPTQTVQEATRTLERWQLDQLPVVGPGRRLVGLLDVQDVLAQVRQAVPARVRAT